MSIWSWFTRRRLDDEDLAEEIQAHLKIAADERMADGADRQAAQLASQKEFGNVTLTREAAHSVWTPWWIDAVHDQVSDLRYAVRALAKNPVFSLTVIGVLTLGIGLNAAVFTMLKGIALTPHAGVAGSYRLHEIFGETSTGRAVSLSYADYKHVRDHDRAFSGLMGSTVVTVGLGRGRSSRALSGELVTGNYFQVLGVGAQIGRTLLPSDEIAPGAHPVVVLSHGLWTRDFGADPGIVGKTVVINNYPLTVVGVADPAFHGAVIAHDNEVFIPLVMAAELGFALGSVQTTQGYLQPGTSLANASAQTEALWSTIARDRPLNDATERLRIAPFWNAPGSPQTFVLPTLIVLSAMGLLVLGIACANIAGLVLVRALSRRGEIGVRLALGAPRSRIVRLLIVENLVLAVPGGVLGVLLASRGLPVLIGYADWLAAPQRLFFNIGIDYLVVSFAVAVACGSALVFGFVPALQSSRMNLVSVINEDASPRGAARGRLRAGLVVAQVAVSLLLLVGAGLVTRSFDAAQHQHADFDPSHVTSIRVDVRQNGYDEARGRVFYRRLLDAARQDAGIEAATLAAYNPVNLAETGTQRAAVEGYEPRRNEDLSVSTNTVGPDYFRTVRIALTAGRAFEDRDDEKAAPVAIVNGALAERFWSGAANALGKRVRVGAGEWRTVIGVAANVKSLQVNESARPKVYLPLMQAYRPAMILHTRGPAPVEVLVERARGYVAALDPNLPVDARPMTERIAGTMFAFNLAATMLFIFGVAGMALAAMGTYALVSYAVKQSTHEIGIRMALGASGPSVVREFLARGLRLGAIGAAAGLVAALGVTRFLSGVLYGVSATDVPSFLRALVLVLGGVVVATLVPAWRAARTNPLSALRHH